MRHPEYLVLIALGLLILFLFIRKKPSFIIKKAIRKRSIKTIKDLANNELVRIKGKIVLLGKTLQAPLSKRICVYYHVEAEDVVSRNDFLHNNINVSETKVTDIVIFDGTHYAVADKHKIQAHVLKDHSQSTTFLQSTSDELRAFLKRKGYRAEDYVGWSQDLYAQEGVLEEGESVELLGLATWKPSSEFPHLRIPAERVLFIEPSNEAGVYLSDEEVW
jgi:hypothetical protein